MTAKTLNLKSLTEEQRTAFIEGWKNAGGYMDDADSPNPWCAPWTSFDYMEVEGDNFEEMGADWWRQCKAEIESNLATEAALAE